MKLIFALFFFSCQHILAQNEVVEIKQVYSMRYLNPGDSIVTLVNYDYFGSRKVILLDFFSYKDCDSLDESKSEIMVYRMLDSTGVASNQILRKLKMIRRCSSPGLLKVRAGRNNTIHYYKSACEEKFYFAYLRRFRFLFFGKTASVYGAENSSEFRRNAYSKATLCMQQIIMELKELYKEHPELFVVGTYNELNGYPSN